MLATAVGGAEYPRAPIRFIVPQPPGGGTDVVARMLAPGMSAALRQQVIVDNRSGAGGIVGTDIAAHMRIDWHIPMRYNS